MSRQDVALWDNETYKFAVYGSKVFHSGDELGSEIAVSCDMCHPRAAKAVQAHANVTIAGQRGGRLRLRQDREEPISAQ